MNPLVQAIAWTVANSVAVGLAIALATIYVLDWMHRSPQDAPTIAMTRREHLWDQGERIAIRLFMLTLAIFAIISSAQMEARNVEPPAEMTWAMILIRLDFTLISIGMVFGDVRRLRTRSRWEEMVYGESPNQAPTNVTDMVPPEERAVT